MSQETAILDRVLEPVTHILTPSVAREIVELRADPSVQARLDDLAAKSNQGRLSEAERREYRDYVEALDFVGILQAVARTTLARSAAN
jgi:hypothetical protein